MASGTDVTFVPVNIMLNIKKFEQFEYILGTEVDALQFRNLKVNTIVVHDPSEDRNVHCVVCLAHLLLQCCELVRVNHSCGCLHG